MKVANQNNLHQQFFTTQGSQLLMEKHERSHLEQSFEPVKGSLKCFSRELNYLDSEFCSTLEKKGHADFYSNDN